jgi:hypothetical protein
MAEIITPEEIARHYAAAMDSVNLINRINAQLVITPSDADTITRNKAHLVTMLAKTFWTTENLELLSLSASNVKQPYTITAKDLAEKWQAIKAKRDSIKSAGAQVGTYWFHTDADSRIQQLGLKDQARDVLAAGGNTATVLQKLGQDIPWQTMSGAAVPMTVQLSFAVVAAVGDLDALCHYVALQHKAAMEAAADPSVYNFSGNWPVAFGG